ncbi:MAG TPA: amino-acid racemase, partial [Cytophagales bacterium]|nr:amino-acid racemase [Cytophagales bacterium]
FLRKPYLIPEKESVEIVGGSSDMLVLDIGENEDKFKIGDLVTFKLKYMGALRLLNSAYIEKRLK